MTQFTDNHSHILARAAHALSCGGVAINTEQSFVDSHGSSGYTITLILESPNPITDDERNILRSAAHVLVFDEFHADHLDPALLNIYIILPLTPTTPSSASPHPVTQTCAEWNNVQRQGLEDFILRARRCMVVASYRNVIDTYPWRKRDAMETALPALVEDACDRLTNTVFNVNAILPNEISKLSAYDRVHVLKNVATRLGRDPTSNLEIYETVYDMVARAHPVSLSTRMLFDAIFAV